MQNAGSAPSNWGRFGTDDERGALNLIDENTVRDAAALVKEGRVYPLGLKVQRKGVPVIDFRPTTERLTLFRDTDTESFRRLGSDGTVGVNEDVLVVPTHNGTHVDALAHMAVSGTLYNGHSADSVEAHRGAMRCGIEKTATVVGRGVVIDVARHKGVPYLQPGTPIGADDLKAALSASDISLHQGDIVLIRTGWLELFNTLGRGDAVPFAQPGITLQGAHYLADHDVAAVGADNAAVEVIPFDQDRYLCVHEALLHNCGITLYEHLVLQQLAKDKVSVGLFVASALPITGGTGSPVNPVLIV